MALVVNDRIKETSTTTGVGTFDLAGAVSGFETFVAGIGNSNTTYYAIVNSNGEFEVGLGTVTDAATDTLSRDTIISSSNSDSAVNFSAGTKNVFCTLPASKAVILDSSGNIAANNGSNLTNLNADNLASGTVPDARFPATLPAISGANLTNLDADDLASGTVPDARFPATLPAADGSALTALNASNVASGTLSSDRLPTVPTTKGGTGLTAIGTANQVIAVNSGATALEYQTVDLANLNADNLTSGTVPDARFPATLPAASGANLTALNASELSSGTVPIARVDLNLLTTSTSDGDGDFFVVVDSVGAEKKLTKANINNSGFNNDSGFTTNTGTVTSVSGGDGLTGSVTTSGSLAVGAGTGIDVAADSVSIDLSELTTSTSDGDGDFFAVVDAANAQKKLTKGNIAISGFNNDSGFTTNTGTVTSVTGGNGLTGSVTTSGSLAVGAGTGIDVAADAISVDVSDFMTNGSNNRVVTATGTDAMNAEANMTFDGSTLDVTGAIRATGDVTAFYSSDKNLKENISNIENSLDKVSKLNGVYYNWTKEAQEKHSHFGEEKEVGVIAQDVEAVLPEIVATREDGTKAVRYERLCAVLIESIKELKKEIEELKSGA
jgi:hypothetical protein